MAAATPVNICGGWTFCICPIIHAASVFFYQQLEPQAGLQYYHLEGFTLYLSSCSMRYDSFPFSFLHIKALLMHLHDSRTFPSHGNQNAFLYLGSSHQIFHILVVIGAPLGNVDCLPMELQEPKMQDDLGIATTVKILVGSNPKYSQ
jgi:hypothetical protein